MFTRYGFTSVFDTGSPWENTLRILERIESGEVLGPRIRSTGEALIAPGAMPSDSILGILGDMPIRNIEVTSAAEAVVGAKKQLELGVDGIKIIYSLRPHPSRRFPGTGFERL